MSLRGKRDIISYQMTSQRRFMNTSWLSLLVAASFASLYHRITGAQASAFDSRVS